MPKITHLQTSIPEFGHYVNNLWSAFTLLTSKNEIRELFRDLFTHTEYKMFAKRFEIARSLLMGQSYQDIRSRLHVTDRSISAVSNILSDRGDGYRKAHDRLLSMEEKLKRKPNRRSKFSRPTVLGAAIKAGLFLADKEITKRLKVRSARKSHNL